MERCLGVGGVLMALGLLAVDDTGAECFGEKAEKGRNAERWATPPSPAPPDQEAKAVLINSLETALPKLPRYVFRLFLGSLIILHRQMK